MAYRSSRSFAIAFKTTVSRSAGISGRSRLGRGDAFAVRVNPREPDVAPPNLSIPAGALEAIAGIDAALRAISGG